MILDIKRKREKVAFESEARLVVNELILYNF